MQLIVLGSSSAGNCYLLKSSTGETLMLECGVKIDKIKQAIGFTFKNIVGCLVTHDHGDHCKSAPLLLKCGVKIYATKGTINFCGWNLISDDCVEIKPREIFSVGSFKVLPFKVNHDAVDPVGFIINHSECGSVLFLTDTYFVREKFHNINHVLIEANFSEQIIVEKNLEDFRRNRIYKSHLSLETCIETLRANDLSKVRNIVLIHLSDSNSDAQMFHDRVVQETGKPVHIADVGLKISLHKKTMF